VNCAYSTAIVLQTMWSRQDIFALCHGEWTKSMVDFANFDLEFHSLYDKFDLKNKQRVFFQGLLIRLQSLYFKLHNICGIVKHDRTVNNRTTNFRHLGIRLGVVSDIMAGRGNCSPHKFEPVWLCSSSKIIFQKYKNFGLKVPYSGEIEGHNWNFEHP